MAHFKIHCNIKKARTSPSPDLVTLNHSTGTHIYTAAYLLINQYAFCRFFFLLALTYGLRGDWTCHCDLAGHDGSSLLQLTWQCLSSIPAVAGREWGRMNRQMAEGYFHLCDSTVIDHAGSHREWRKDIMPAGNSTGVHRYSGTARRQCLEVPGTYGPHSVQL